MNVRRALIAKAALMVTVFAGTAGADDASLAESLRSCAGIEDADMRLACFDELAGAVPASAAPTSRARPAPPVTAPAPAQPPPAAAPPVTDDVGIESVRGTDDERPEWSVTISRCEEDRRMKQLYFFFENGQVWKMVNYRRLGLRDCRFGAVLTQDVFGFKLELPDDGRTIRVSRLR